ncbi:proteasome complex subunit Rpn13 ubiquitin receptor-domain-containing protein [Phascolomyces articulosus]|uniref:Proteasome complex subunit Rpn13 ubiquitin receptor-domain-containing protein n=1 Tax=Phascolomyces articulosus TaxID=60185 RepID=A0AAD5JUR1_9FUNG|nr:proteasome complex subunit Rpn13 ubiquitin receptor-domain-containing protein [Phascolomyces articulosus]
MSFFPTAQRPKHLVQFNAGKCIREGNTIKPDLRKGMIYMDQTDDQLMYFYWKERKASEPEEERIIFPDEAEFVRVTECTTGRVYSLNYKSSGEKLFFWMQNKSDEKDDEYVSRVNRLINDPQSAVLEQSGSGGSSAHTRMPGIDVDFGDGAPPDMMQLLGNSPGIDRVSRENIIQFLQTAGGLGGTIPSSVAAGGDGPVDQQHTEEHREETSDGDNNNNTSSQQQSSTVNSEQLEQLRNILRGVQAPDNQQSPLSLTDVLTTQTLTPLLNDREICSALFPFLPEESERSPEEVRQVVQSPQFQQALATLSFALESGELGPLLTQLGLDPSAGTSVESFLRAIEQQARRREQERNNDAMDED